MKLEPNANIEHISLEAVVIRADGRREDLGVIAEWDKSRFKRLLYRLRGKGRVHHHRR